MKVISVFFSIVLAIYCPYAHSQSIHIDSSFGTNGMTIITLPDVQSGGESIKLQSDGKIIVGGITNNEFFSPRTRFALVRLMPNGIIDSSFGFNGISTLDFGNKENILRDIAIQNDGKIIAVGTTLIDTISPKKEYFAVARFNSNGDVDSSFGIIGKSTVSFDYRVEASATLIQPDEKIVIVGTLFGSPTKSDYAIARLNKDGTLDTEFGLQGKIVTDFDSSVDRANALSILEDGKILVVGAATFRNSHQKISIVRYLPNGDIDPEFDGNGKVGSNAEFSGVANSIKIRKDNKIIVGGVTANGHNSDFFIAQFLENGYPDTNFGDSGMTQVDFGTGGDQLYAIELMDDGTIIGAGQAYNGREYDFGFIHLNGMGRIDSLKDIHPISLFDTDSSDDYDCINSTILQADSKILIAGFATNSFIVARYQLGATYKLPASSDLRRLDNVFPNPSRNSISIKYKLLKNEKVSISILDVLGNTMHCFIKDVEQSIGDHIQNLQIPESVPSGVYWVVVSSPTNIYRYKALKN